jgi:hypothetical protein
MLIRACNAEPIYQSDRNTYSAGSRQYLRPSRRREAVLCLIQLTIRTAMHADSLPRITMGPRPHTHFMHERPGGHYARAHINSSDAQVRTGPGAWPVSRPRPHPRCGTRPACPASSPVPIPAVSPGRRPGIAQEDHRVQHPLVDDAAAYLFVADSRRVRDAEGLQARCAPRAWPGMPRTACTREKRRPILLQTMLVVWDIRLTRSVLTPSPRSRPRRALLPH